jgi:Type IV secretion-system coupling protein DNA-binding domain
MAQEASNVWQFPNAGGAGATRIGTDNHTGAPVYISRQARGQGTSVWGATGTGKSNFMLGMIEQDMREGRGVCVVEPHGDLTRRVLALVPEERVRDVILLDMQDEHASFGLNPFECADLRSPTEVAKTAAFLMHTFSAIWQVGPETPQLAQVLRHVTRTCIEAQAS